MTRFVKVFHKYSFIKIINASINLGAFVLIFLNCHEIVMDYYSIDNTHRDNQEQNCFLEHDE